MMKEWMIDLRAHRGIGGTDWINTVTDLLLAAKRGELDEEALIHYWSHGESDNPLYNYVLDIARRLSTQKDPVQITDKIGRILRNEKPTEQKPFPVRIPAIQEAIELFPQKPLMGITVDFPFKPLPLPETSTLIVAEEPLQARIISTIITSAQQNKDKPIIFYCRGDKGMLKLQLTSGKMIQPLRDNETDHLFYEAQQRTRRVNRQLRCDPIIVILQDLDYVVNHTKSETAINLGWIKEFNAPDISFIAAITPVRYQQLLANHSEPAKNFYYERDHRQFHTIAWGNVLGSGIAQAAGPLAESVQKLSPSKFIFTSGSQQPKTYWAPR